MADIVDLYVFVPVEFSQITTRADYFIPFLLQVLSISLNLCAAVYYSLNAYFRKLEGASSASQLGRYGVITINILSIAYQVSNFPAIYLHYVSPYVPITSCFYCLMSLINVLVNLQILLLFRVITPIRFINNSNIVRYRSIIVAINFLTCGWSYLQYWAINYDYLPDFWNSIRLYAFLLWALFDMCADTFMTVFLVYHTKKHLLTLSRGKEAQLVSAKCKKKHSFYYIKSLHCCCLNQYFNCGSFYIIYDFL